MFTTYKPKPTHTQERREIVTPIGLTLNQKYFSRENMLCEQDGGLAIGGSTSALLSHVF